LSAPNSVDCGAAMAQGLGAPIKEVSCGGDDCSVYHRKRTSEWKFVPTTSRSGL
jgi:hypothetical protein